MALGDEVAKARSLITRWTARDTRANMEQANQAITHIGNALTDLGHVVIVQALRDVRAKPEVRVASQLIEAQTYLQEFLVGPQDTRGLTRAHDALSILTGMLAEMEVYEFPAKPKISMRFGGGGMVRPSSGGAAGAAAVVNPRRAGKSLRIKGVTVNRAIMDEIGEFLPDEDL